MSPAQSDRNLLFGTLAVQTGFVNREALLRAMSAWVLDKARPLGQILREQGALAEEHHALLEALVRAHLEQHGDDPARSLATLSTGADVRQSLEGLTDPDVQASPARGSATPEAPGHTAYAPAGPPARARYRILRPHARGGLGLVSVALDEELRREVALKEIQPRHAGQPESRARFLLEAEVTGGLEHPGVVPVYGLGAYPDGRPFYAMRLIQGDSLKEALARFYRDRAGLAAGERALRLRQLLARFVAVCNAVAYAHSRGVLHRDLKPANVMLGPFGETLVVDWGLAKIVGRADGAAPGGALRPTPSADSAETQPGAALGTPAYMSPEQAAGRLDQVGPASDVYSLGATLYSLLTGRQPFTDREAAEVLRRVQRGDFPRPREVSPDAPPALEAVCLKAMALRPEDRYGSAQELAADVERWLADEPVGAYREPAPARLARWARRHRASVMSAAATLAVLALSLGALAAVLTGHNRALAAANASEREAREQEHQARDQEREARDRAQANFRLAREAVKEYCVKVTLNPRLRQADLTGLRKDLLATAARFHERFKDQAGDDPEVRAERAYAYFELAYIAGHTGAAEEALGHYRQSLALWGPLVEAHPDHQTYRWGLAVCCNDVANLYASLGRAGEAEEAYRKAVTLKQELADAEPSNAYRQADLALSCGNLAYWLAGRDRLKDAEALYEKAIAVWQALVGADPDNPRSRRGLADARHKLGFLYARTNRSEQAGGAYRQALALRQELHRKDPDNPQYLDDLGWSYYNLGQWYRAAGRAREAEGSFRQAVDVRQKLADRFPSAPRYQSALALALGGLGLFYQADGRTQEALRAYQRGLAIEERLVKTYPANVKYAVDLGGSYCNMGRRLWQNGAAQESLGWLDKAQATLEGAQRRDRGNATARLYLRATHNNRAEALLLLDRPAEALRQWDGALALGPAKDADRLFTLVSRAYTLARLGRYEGAVSQAEEHLKRPAANQDTTYRAARLFARASAAARADGRREQAERYAERAAALLRRAHAEGYQPDAEDVADLEKGAEFRPLRQRPDFPQLLEDLQKKP
jgi:serine/threonine-protein kinase